ncbi:MAG: methylated-DNA--[protein]-cysteine S-methyltransferase [Phycisphaerales bacterium]|nr:methylated-DNA--[protein]-cysteine S-methyltransferase [Phycisphaerales bacterium]
MGDVERQFGTSAPEPTDAAHPILDVVRAQLSEYFDARRATFDVPLDLRGSAWERSVWEQLLLIPCGQTRSYEDVALALQRPGAQRAVGLANGRNRIAIVVPCHRVIQKDGGLRGYGGGLERKAFLLDLERSITGASLW